MWLFTRGYVVKLKLDLNIHIIHFPTIHLPVWKEAVDGWKVETLVSQTGGFIDHQWNKTDPTARIWRRKTLGSGDDFPTQAMQIPMSLWDYMLCKMMWKCICAAARAFWNLGQNDEQVLDVLIYDIYDCFSCRMCI